MTCPHVVMRLRPQPSLLFGRTWMSLLERVASDARARWLRPDDVSGDLPWPLPAPRRGGGWVARPVLAGAYVGRGQGVASDRPSTGNGTVGGGSGARRAVRCRCNCRGARLHRASEFG